MSNIRRRIQSLHPGQAVIVAAVIGAAGGGLLSLRHTVDRKRTRAETALSQAQREIDSLDAEARFCADTTVRLSGALARAANRAMLDGRLPSSGGLIEPVDANCSAIPERTRGQKALRADAEDARDGLGVQVVALGLLGFLSVAAALLFLWVWFDGRRAA